MKIRLQSVAAAAITSSMLFEISRLEGAAHYLALAWLVALAALLLLIGMQWQQSRYRKTEDREFMVFARSKEASENLWYFRQFCRNHKTVEFVSVQIGEHSRVVLVLRLPQGHPSEEIAATLEPFEIVGFKFNSVPIPGGKPTEESSYLQIVRAEGIEERARMRLA